MKMGIQNIKIKWMGLLTTVFLSACSGSDSDLGDVQKTYLQQHETRADVVERTFESEKAGSLNALGSEGRVTYAGVEKLTIKGSINKDDIVYVRDSLEVTMLDLSDARFTFTEISSGIFNINYSTDGGFTEITLPKEGITSIGSSAFSCCKSMTHIVLPNSLTSIGGSAFYRCSALTNISFPESLTSIGGSAFYECSSLTNISFPKSLTSIGGSAFYRCNAIQTIVSRSNLNIKSTIKGSQYLLVYYTNGNFTPEDKDAVNVVVDGVCESLEINTLNNELDFMSYIQTANKITYVKNICSKHNEWHTITLPFTATSITDKQGRSLAPFDSNMEGDYNFWLCTVTPNGFEDATTIEQNHPYLIAFPVTDFSSGYCISGDITFVGENVTLSKELVEAHGPGYTLYPTYEARARARDIFVLNSDYWMDGYDYGSVFIHSTLEVDPYEAYIMMDDGGTSMRSVLTVSGNRSAVRKGAAKAASVSSRAADGLRIPQKGDM